ncbi:conserved hypothetical protein [Burkholderiales bacterium 8X]|nr:conserved hypothetical protein [Burkholderiales bacterium 8X]
MSDRSTIIDTQRWKLTRNCTLRPAAFACHIGALLAFSGIVGGLFWALGYPGVMTWCAAEMLLLCGAALVYARHAADGERVKLEGARLQIETFDGAKVRTYELHPAWVRLERDSREHLTLCSGRVRLPLGRHANDLQRRRFAKELTAALTQAQGRGFAPHPNADAAELPDQGT